MTPEEFQRIKEAEKEHLRSVRKLKATVRELERQKKLTRAVRSMTDGPDLLRDTHDEMLEKIAIETAMNEARLDVALSETEEQSRDAPLRSIVDDEVLRRARARELVRQMSMEGSSLAPESTPTAAAQTAEASSISKEPVAPEKAPPLPEKTIGRMKPRPDQNA